MKYFFILSATLLVLQESVAPPVTKEEANDKENEVQEKEELNLEYGRYLQEVVSALESDEKFRKRLQTANDSDIRTGKIAYELDLVSHQVRSKLDELKRQELVRLRQTAREKYKHKNGLETDHLKILKNTEHLDHSNIHTFEISDLKKLIEKVTKDLDEADEKRREEFKEYEMHKKFEQEQKMKNMTEEDKKNYEKELEDLEKKHKDHEPLHHPGSKKQLEEVWKEQDHFDTQKFDPQIFFKMHDLDGNGVWDEEEVKVLLLREIHKLPGDDTVEKNEELERMTEHIFREADLNKDRLISYDEFKIQSNKKEFDQDPGWETLDQQPIYSEQEYEAYKQEVEKAIARSMSQEYAGQGGHQQFPSHPNQVPQYDHMQQPGQYQHAPQQQQYHQQQQYPQQQQYHHQQQQQQQQQQQYHQQQQYPQQGHYPGQAPQPNQYNPPHGGYQQQMHQQAQYDHQIPQQQQYHPNDINYVPQQQNLHSNQQLPVGKVPPPPQGQFQQPQVHPNEIPQQTTFQQPPVAQANVQQQFQQPPQVHDANAIPQAPPAPNANAIHQQVPPVPNTNVNQQQFQPPHVILNGNEIPKPQFNQPAGQGVPAANNGNQPPQQTQQNQPPVNTAQGGNQQHQAAAGQNQH